MGENKNIITIGQMTFILILTIVGAGILTLPRNLAEAIDYDYWIVLLVGGLAITIVSLIHVKIIKLRPKEEYFSILCAALTKPIAYLVGIGYVIYLVGIAGLIVRIFGEVIKLYLLTFTPIEVINVSILATIIYLARKGVGVLGRMLQLIFPIIIAITMFIILASFKDIQFSNLLPIFASSFPDILKATPVVMFSFVGIEMLLFFAVYLEEPKKVSITTISIWVVILIYIIIVLSVLAKFGSIQTKHLLWPTLELFDTIEIPGLFIERLQVLVMSTWVIVIFSTIAPIYMAAITMVESMTKSRDQAYLAIPFLPFIYFASIVPESITASYQAIEKYTKFSFPIMAFLIPLIVLISLSIQNKRRKGQGSNA